MTIKNINVACGDSFIVEKSWINLDYVSSHPSIQKVDLLGGLPFDTDSVNVVYSSHFLEHIPRTKVLHFLRDCHRILVKHGKIRLILPDWENLCQEYLKRRTQYEHDKADFVLLEMIDQCVRVHSGGLLGDYFSYIKKNSNDYSEMIDYIKIRCGEDLMLFASNDPDPPNSREELYFWNSTISKVLNVITNPSHLIGRLQENFSSYRIKLATALLPQAFREQNVSYASIGEKHAWMWDFYTLGKELERAGFHSIKRLSFDRTDIDGFPLVPLDMTPEGLPRKGESSMYIEAEK